MASDEETSSVEYSRLGLLIDGPMHGYELARRFREESGIATILHAKRSNLYGMLAKLNRKGYLASDRIDQLNRPTKRIFHITDDGMKAFMAWIQSPVENERTMRIGFLARLFFAYRESPAAALDLVARQKIACIAWRERQEQQRRRSVSGDTGTFDSLVYDFRAGQIDSTLAWLERCTRFLQGCAQRPADLHRSGT